MAKQLSKAGILVKPHNGKLAVYRLDKKGIKGGLTLLGYVNQRGSKDEIQAEIEEITQQKKNADGSRG